MNAFNLSSIWGAFLLLIFFYIYDKFLKKTSFRKLGKPISLLIFILLIILPGFFKIGNAYLYRFMQSISVIFALNLMDKKTWGEVK
ncbi:MULTISPECIES: hypothetical protein [Lutispora]|uniref:Holin n=1 Tax=Lutispora saccharofermentans TaxID=3024236 RepID=A0ABT1NLP1_9FIRM|nr:MULTISPECIES: hypothetical protein [Lutispora]MCQ1531514.1 hypothetical protein [Lutispora saccharofermentans]MEA4961560.1 hypothetical protein [Lutispora sp.]